MRLFPVGVHDAGRIIIRKREKRQNEKRNKALSIGLISHQMVQLMAMMALGFVLCKTNVVDRDFNKKLTGLLNNCALPATILAAVLNQPAERDMNKFLLVTVVSFGYYILMPALSYLMVKACRFIPRKEQGQYMFMLTFSNVGFMGIPVVQALFGNEGVLYAAVLNIAFNVSTFTIGVLLINYGQDDGKGVINLRKLLSPCVVASVTALLIYLLGIQMPEDLISICDTVGGITTPVAMILIGSTLGTMKAGEVFGDWKVYPFTLFKQIVLPVLIMWVIGLVVKDAMMNNVLSVLMLMPVANLAVILSYQYDRDEKLASRVVLISTLISVVTIPLMLFWMQK